VTFLLPRIPQRTRVQSSHLPPATHTLWARLRGLRGAPANGLPGSGWWRIGGWILRVEIKEEHKRKE